MTTAFDADVLIYAAAPAHPLGPRVAALFDEDPAGGAGGPAGFGSLLLLPEVLAKPLREGAADEVRALSALLARLELRPLDRAIASLAVVLAANHRLRAADATHLATAVSLGADRFLTNNQRDFPADIDEIQVTYPEDLPEPVRAAT
ncbi:hypothetical protein BH24ACT3_BH24ACT3_06870 [soil metagenome]